MKLSTVVYPLCSKSLLEALSEDFTRQSFVLCNTGAKPNQTMVNLVVSHRPDSTSTSVPNVGAVDLKSPPSTTGRGIPVSPLTQNESLFGAGLHLSSGRKEEREQPPLVSVPSGKKLEMICDYDRSCTQLYEMLESSQWNDVCSRCQTHPEEVHTWIVRRDANGNIRWKLLPLHAAVIFKAPLSLIRDLFRAHPVAATQQDDQGLLPLHLAFRHKSNEAVIEIFLHQYPRSVMIKDQRGRFPLDHGKEMRFSADLMGLYAKTFIKCQQTGMEEITNEEEIKVTYENRMSALKGAFEARIFELQNSHEQARETMTIQTQRELQRNREELAELRGQLAIEKAVGEKAPKLEAELRGLSSSLGDATHELATLRRVVQEQNQQKETLLEEMQQILKDQKAIHDRCSKQQEQLDQAQKLREQLLRTLIQKENGKAVQVSKEICQLSNSNIARTEKLLCTFSLGEESTRGLPNNHHEDPGNAQRDSYLSNYQYQDSTEDVPSDNLDNGDDISEITDSSYVRPFGDR